MGAAATVGYGTDAEIDEAIAVLALTQIGERSMAPSFGVPDPAFHGIHTGDIQVGLNDHGPAGVTIQTITNTPATETLTRATIHWTRTNDKATS